MHVKSNIYKWLDWVGAILMYVIANNCTTCVAICEKFSLLEFYELCLMYIAINT